MPTTSHAHCGVHMSESKQWIDSPPPFSQNLAAVSTPAHVQAAITLPPCKIGAADTYGRTTSKSMACGPGSHSRCADSFSFQLIAGCSTNRRLWLSHVVEDSTLWQEDLVTVCEQHSVVATGHRSKTSVGMSHRVVRKRGGERAGCGSCKMPRGHGTHASSFTS